MRLITLFLLLIGGGLLAVLLIEVDLGQVWGRLEDVGTWGIAAVLMLRVLVVAADSYAWQLTLPSVPQATVWFGRLWNVMLIGEALNKVLPLASVGGEPVKIALLHKRFGIDLREATASIVLWQTLNNFSMVAFVAIGFAAMFAMTSLDPAFRLAAAAGLVAFAVGIALFFLIQRKKVVSRIAAWLGRRFGARAERVLLTIHDVEDRLIAFYGQARERFGAAFLLCFSTWVLSAVEIHLALHLMGYPASWIDSLVIAAVTVLVRAALFMVPAGIGTQDGALVLICGSITGSPDLGLALAAILRLRELVWVAVGLMTGWFYAAFRHRVKEG